MLPWARWALACLVALVLWSPGAAQAEKVMGDDYHGPNPDKYVERPYGHGVPQGAGAYQWSGDWRNPRSASEGLYLTQARPVGDDQPTKKKLLTHLDMIDCAYDSCPNAPEGWSIVEQHHEGNGLDAIVFRDNATGDLVVAFAGTDTSSRADVMADITQGGGVYTPQYARAIELAKDLSGNLAPGQNLSFTGHSLGGGLAAACAMVTGHKADTFNAAGVHAHTLAAHGRIAWGDEKLIRSYVVEGEALNSIQTPLSLWNIALNIATLRARPLAILPNQWVAPPALGEQVMISSPLTEQMKWTGLEKHGMAALRSTIEATPEAEL